MGSIAQCPDLDDREAQALNPLALNRAGAIDSTQNGERPASGPSE
jgi:hypothetical protein